MNRKPLEFRTKKSFGPLCDFHFKGVKRRGEKFFASLSPRVFRRESSERDEESGVSRPREMKIALPHRFSARTLRAYNRLARFFRTIAQESFLIAPIYRIDTYQNRHRFCAKMKTFCCLIFRRAN